MHARRGEYNQRDERSEGLRSRTRDGVRHQTYLGFPAGQAGSQRARGAVLTRSRELWRDSGAGPRRRGRDGGHGGVSSRISVDPMREVGEKQPQQQRRDVICRQGAFGVRRGRAAEQDAWARHRSSGVDLSDICHAFFTCVDAPAGLNPLPRSAPPYAVSATGRTSRR